MSRKEKIITTVVAFLFVTMGLFAIFMTGLHAVADHKQTIWQLGLATGVVFTLDACALFFMVGRFGEKPMKGAKEFPEFLYSPPGTGKSEAVRERLPDNV